MQQRTMMSLIYAGLALTAALFYFSVQVAPLFTTYVAAILLSSLVFMGSEKWMTHDAAEFENRFWSLSAFCLSLAVLFAADSPARLRPEYEGIGWCVAIVVTYLVHIYDRHLRRLTLRQIPHFERSLSSLTASSPSFPASLSSSGWALGVDSLSSSSSSPALRLSAEELSLAQNKALSLTQLIHSLDMIWVSSSVLNAFFLPHVLYQEKQIVKILSESTRDELNYLLPRVELARILYKVKDHRFARSFHRSQLLELLCEERVRELSVHAKAVLLDALQKVKLSAHPRMDVYVKNVFLSTKGDELSELKCLQDSKGDFHSLHKLLYTDLRSSAVRNEVLAYISAQARVQQAHSSIGTKLGKKRATLAWRKVVSDVDDTLLCCGGSWPKGLDTSFPKNTIYPGVIAFYRELDLGLHAPAALVANRPKESPRNTAVSYNSTPSSVNGNVATAAAQKPTNPQTQTQKDISESRPETDKEKEKDNGFFFARTGNLVFLSARPHVYKDVSESVTYKKLQSLQETRGLHTSPTLLAGSLDTGGRFLVSGDSEPLAQKKTRNLCEYLSLFPEFSCVFIGDNGQGDARTAELVLTNHPEHAKHLVRSYIHIIQPLERTYVKDPRFRQLSNPHVCYFTTYIDAAIDAYNRRFVGIAGLQRVARESVRDFSCVPESAWRSDFSVSSTQREKKERGKEKERSGRRKKAITSSSTSSVASTTSVSVSAAGEGVRSGVSVTTLLAPAHTTSNTSNTTSKTSAAEDTHYTTEHATAVKLSHPLPSATSVVRTSSLSASAIASAIATATAVVRKSTPSVISREKEREKEEERGEMSAVSRTVRAASLSAMALPHSDVSPSAASASSSSSSVVAPAPPGMLKREERMRELNGSLSRANDILRKTGWEEVAPLRFAQLYPCGARVLTVFGAAEIASFREEDGIYELHIEPLPGVNQKNQMKMFVAAQAFQK